MFQVPKEPTAHWRWWCKSKSLEAVQRTHPLLNTAPVYNRSRLQDTELVREHATLLLEADDGRLAEDDAVDGASGGDGRRRGGVGRRAGRGRGAGGGAAEGSTEAGRGEARGEGLNASGVHFEGVEVVVMVVGLECEGEDENVVNLRSWRLNSRR